MLARLAALLVAVMPCVCRVGSLTVFVVSVVCATLPVPSVHVSGAHRVQSTLHRAPRSRSARRRVLLLLVLLLQRGAISTSVHSTSTARCSQRSMCVWSSVAQRVADKSRPVAASPPPASSSSSSLYPHSSALSLHRALQAVSILATTKGCSSSTLRCQ